MENKFEQRENIEKKAFAPGKYEVVVSIREKGKDARTKVDGSTYLYVPGAVEDLEQKARSWASAVGLHNFGMDSRHAVEFSVRDASGAEVHSFSCQFDSSGYPVRKEEKE
jgi:hypothetical protein